MRQRSSALRLHVASAAELAHVRQARSIAVAFHFADGSSSTRPNTTLSAAEAFEPRSPAAQIVGCTLLPGAAEWAARTAEGGRLAGGARGGTRTCSLPTWSEILAQHRLS